MNEPVKYILKDDCDKLFKKFKKLALKLNALNEGITDEYLKSLPINERDFLMKRAFDLHLQFMPLIHFQEATSKYVDHVKATLGRLEHKQKKKDSDTVDDNLA
jgi:hypothetical protein